jgi:hypothetical protein
LGQANRKVHRRANVIAPSYPTSPGLAKVVNSASIRQFSLN